MRVRVPPRALHARQRLMREGRKCGPLCFRPQLWRNSDVCQLDSAVRACGAPLPVGPGTCVQRAFTGGPCISRRRRKSGIVEAGDSSEALGSLRPCVSGGVARLSPRARTAARTKTASCKAGPGREGHPTGEASMTAPACCVGIDVAKATLDVAVRPSGRGVERRQRGRRDRGAGEAAAAARADADRAGGDGGLRDRGRGGADGGRAEHRRGQSAPGAGFRQGDRATRQDGQAGRPGPGALCRAGAAGAAAAARCGGAGPGRAADAAAPAPGDADGGAEPPELRGGGGAPGDHAAYPVAGAGAAGRG